ncbi:MAG: glycosyltransferase family 2 protein [Anaerolineae bacterium]
MSRCDLSIVIISWNVRELLRRCLDSIPESLKGEKGKGLLIETIVFDNGSADGSADMVREDFPWVHLMESEVNLGFIKGNNLAIDQSEGRHILLLNPDTEVVGDALGTMVAYMEPHPRVGALGPQLLNPDGTTQSSRRRFPTLTTAFLESTVLQPWFEGSRILKRYYLLDRPDDEIQPVDWVVGAALLIRRGALEQVGPLDEEFFMYSEELDWCYRLKAQGWEVVYLPTAQVVHHGGRSSEQVLPARHIHFQRSKVLFFKRYYGWPGEVLRWFILSTYLYLFVWEGLKWLVGHKRPLRRERVAAYWQVLRTGLK